MLDPDIRNLMIRFSSLDYLDAEGIRYAYRLEGLESDWNYTSENRSVSYVNLPKGRYRFQVRSTDSKGHWVENTAVLPICIMPRFRETGLARVLFGFILTGIIAVGVFVVSYVYRLRYRVAMERQLADV
ncbi:MAG: hypothetical protein LUE21_01220 [Oscillospiraceae bacterium]|nr:hypothetical protein [Oscillospiraceae bacterium]